MYIYVCVCIKHNSTKEKGMGEEIIARSQAETDLADLKTSGPTLVVLSVKESCNLVYTAKFPNGSRVCGKETSGSGDKVGVKTK